MLFIDELHTVVGAGASEGAMDASQMLKPMLARGELHTIGATTLDEYRKHIEKDAALERRFQTVLVGEPTVEDTISILRGLRERYEIHHSVRFKDAALVAAAVLSHRYISDRFLPDKAIDLVDEAASKLRMEIDSMPAELDEVRRRDHAARDRARGAAQGNRQGLRSSGWRGWTPSWRTSRRRRRGCETQWKLEKDAIQGSRSVKEELEQVAPRASRRRSAAGDYAKASELQYGRLPGAGAAAARAGTRLTTATRVQRMLKEEVDEEDIAEVVAKWTGIPVSRLMEGEVQKLIQMEERLHAARRRPGRSHQGGGQRDPARAGRPAGPEPPARQLHLPGPDRRRQDRARAGAGRVPVRRRARDGAHRHVRVPGEAHRVAHDRRAARIRRLRRGRPADRGGAAAPLRRRALRRGREGAPRGAERAAAAARRRAADRRQGPHGGLQERRRDHDVQPGQPVHRRARRVAERRHPAPGHGGAAAALPAGVHQPDRRDRVLPCARARAHEVDHRHPGRPGC